MKRLLTATTAVLALTAPMAFADTNINVTLQLPETNSLGQNWLQFGELIEEASGGELTIQLFHSAQLFRDNQVPEAVGSGAIEAGSASLVRFAGAVPAVNIVSIPFLLDDEAAQRAATAPGSPVRALLDAAILEETNNRVLWWQAFGRNIFLSNETAMDSPDAFDGMLVRSYGTVQSWTVEALGGSPTIMSGSEQFLAYQQGTVDVGMTAISAVESRNLYEVMDTLTLTNDSLVEFVAVINNDFFEGLSPEEQQIITDAALQVEAALRDQSINGEDAAIERLRANMTVVELDDAQRAAFRDATAGVIERYIEQAGELGEAVIEAANGL